MSRIITEKKERSLGVKLFLKSERCNSPKCVMVRRPQRPGMHGKRRKSLSEFGNQLLEKQKIQLTYGLTNRQLKSLFSSPKSVVLNKLESRLDRVVFLSQLAPSPRVARQLISHGHITVNGRKTTIVSYQVRKGDVIAVRAESRDLKLFSELVERLGKVTPPIWLSLSPKDLSVTCVSVPQGDEMNFPFNIDAVVEFYSR